MVPVEFLLINGAKLDTKDDKGQSALHHATLLGHTGYVWQTEPEPCCLSFSWQPLISHFISIHCFIECFIDRFMASKHD